MTQLNMHPLFPGSKNEKRVKRDCPYLSKNNNVNNKKQYHALLCFSVYGRYTTNCYPDAQTVGATNSGTLTLP